MAGQLQDIALALREQLQGLELGHVLDRLQEIELGVSDQLGRRLASARSVIACRFEPADDIAEIDTGPSHEVERIAAIPRTCHTLMDNRACR